MYEVLEEFAVSAFNQDYDLDSANPDEAVIGFVRRRPHRSMAGLIGELDSLIASTLDEDQIDEIWTEAGGNYDPRDDGMTYREWFAHVRDLLTRPPAN
jgi:hypothetical protein